MVSDLYILHSENMDLSYSSSQILLHRSFYDDLPESHTVIDNFDEIYKCQKPEERTPVIHYKGLNYIYIRQENDVLLLVVTRRNTDVMSMVLFLHKFQDLMKFYLCKSDDGHDRVVFDKDTVIDNVYFIYELLDECIDLGVIQMTDYNILKEYIKVIPNRPDFQLDTGDYSDSEDDDMTIRSNTKAKKNKKMGQKEINKVKSTHNQAIKADEIAIEESHINSSILRASSSAINWRPKGISYAKNEIFVDLIENCEFYYDLQEDVILQNEVFGNCFVKCYLSGMPTCMLGFNESRISRIEKDEVGEQRVRSDNQLREEEEEREEEEDGEEEEDEEMEEMEEGGEEREEGITEDIETTDNQSTLEVVTKEQQKDNTTVSRPKKHIPFRDIQFHQCVQLDSIYNDNLMKFIPPDDKFILMSYHVEQQRQKRKLPLMMIKPTYRVHLQSKKLQILCILSTNFKRRLHGKKMVIKIPIHPVLFNVVIDQGDNALKYKTEMGDVSYQVDSSELIWQLDEVTGKKPSIKMMAELSLADTTNINQENINHTLQNHKAVEEDEDFDDNEEAKRELDSYYGVNGSKSSSVAEIQKKLRKAHSFNHIKISFNIPMLSYTGFRLNYLKVEEEKLNYTCFPWVRYSTQSDRIDSSLFSSAAKSACSYRFKLGPNCFELK